MAAEGAGPSGLTSNRRPDCPDLAIDDQVIFVKLVCRTQEEISENASDADRLNPEKAFNNAAIKKSVFRAVLKTEAICKELSDWHDPDKVLLERLEIAGLGNAARSGARGGATATDATTESTGQTSGKQGASAKMKQPRAANPTAIHTDMADSLFKRLQKYTKNPKLFHNRLANSMHTFVLAHFTTVVLDVSNCLFAMLVNDAFFGSFGIMLHACTRS